MSCSLDAFRESFPEVGSSNTTNLELFSNKENIISWVNLANKQAKAQGFDATLYEVVQKNVIKKFGRNKGQLTTISQLNVNRDNLNQYQDFIKEVLMPDVTYSQELSETFDQDIDDNYLGDNKISFNYGDSLFSNLALDDETENSSSQEEFLNFTEWVEMRRQLLADLQETKRKLLLQKAEASQLQQVSIAIYKLEQELEDINTDDVKNIHNGVFEEMKNISEIITIAADTEGDPALSATIFDNNYISERIADLKRALYPIEGQYGETLINFHKGLSEENINKLQANLRAVEEKYNAAVPKILNNIILNNDYIHQLRSNVNQSNDEDIKKEFQKLETMVKELLDIKNQYQSIDGDEFLGLNTLGANSYDSILAEIVVILRDINNAKEVGITSIHKKKMQQSYEQLVNIKIGDDFFIDSLWAKDDFGQKTKYLISPFTSSFFSKISSINNGQKVFNQAEKYSESQREAYETWMNNLASNVDFIEPYRLSYFKKKYGDNPDFQNYFASETDESMSEYEQELINKMGKTAFELEIQKQERAIETFLVDAYVTESDRQRKNPFAFIEHFYSTDYLEANKETGEYMLPTYARYIPALNKDIYYNQEFKSIEDKGGKAFTDFYKSASSLLSYNSDVFRAAGMDVNPNDIINIADNTGRAAMKDLSTFKKIGKHISAIWNSIGSEFFEGGHEKDPYNRGNINTHYNDYGQSQHRQIVDLYTNHKTYEEAVKKLEEIGLKVPDKYQKMLLKASNIKIDTKNITPEKLASLEANKAKNVENVRNYIKRKIAQAIATNTINKTSSLDIVKRVSYATAIAESVATRKNTVGVINLIRDYTSANNLTNISKFLAVWEANNIFQPGSLTKNLVGRMESKEVLKSMKKYSAAEKELLALYKEEKENINSKDTFNFTHIKKVHNEITNQEEMTGYVYKTDPDHPDGRWLRTTLNSEGKVDEDSATQSLSLEEISEAYEYYLADKIDNLGTRTTTGRILGGLMWNMFRHYLYISPKSGITNRVQGKVQNNQAASSGLHGFNSENLYNARWLLTGMGANKLINYLPFTKGRGLNNTKRAQQWGILDHLTQELGLLSNVMQDLSGGDGSTGFHGSAIGDKFKEFMGDFAMNIPEMHNQMELLVAMMQDPKFAIKDIHGNSRLLFDPETMTFPFDPVTMQLLPDYRTPENIANWEEFTTDKDGKAPQNILIQNYQVTRDKLHGNYRNNDKIALQSSMVGRGLSSFMKWSFENMNNQYGSKKVSLTRGEVFIKGRKRVLMQSAPTMFTHMMLNNVGIVSLATGGYAIAAGTGLLGTVVTGAAVGFPVVGALFTGGILAYNLIKNRDNIKFSKDDWKLSANYALEIALRTAKTLAVSSTGNIGIVRNNVYSDQKVSKWVGADKEAWKHRNISWKERQIMSESVQEMADKYTTYAQFTLAGLLLKGSIYMLALLNAGDDEDEKKEMYWKLLEEHEGKFKMLINTRNNIIGDTEKWTNPWAMRDAYSKIILAQFIKESIDKVTDSQQKVEDGNISQEQAYYQMAQGAGGLFFGVPKQVLLAGEQLFAEDGPKRNLVSDDRIFDNSKTNVIDKWLLSGHLEGEEKYKPLVESKRKKLRKDLESVFKKRLRENDVDPSSDEGKKILKKNIDQVVKDYEITTGNNKRSNEEIWENTNWDDITKDVKSNGEVILDSDD